ncbi:MAG: SDR family NAD(P)-dependent oxidoreductase [Anaerolineaceae bacterium]|nr:SDR family NAD(P)-dependent oxidoreductase [Anaerolineaceae bacterium]
MENYWNNKVALITGASSGIGASIARNFASHGLTVVLIARRQNKLEQVAEQITNNGGKVLLFTADLSKEAERVAVMQTIIEKVGVPDILVNNAGIGYYGYFAQMPWDVARDLIRLNIEATTHFTSMLLPAMLIKPKARIINIGSIMGKMPEQGVALYAASKGYVDSFTKSIYRDLRGTNVSISVLRPGPVKTEFFDRSETYENGGRIPAEQFAVSADRVAQAAWSLINHPCRYRYVPFFMAASVLLEGLFSWVIDLVGPAMLILRDKKKLS